MSAEKLVRMANDVARYFSAYPTEVAVAEVRQHLEAFWPRRMRQDALAALDAGERGFDPLVIAALEAMRAAAPAIDAADGVPPRRLQG